MALLDRGRGFPVVLVHGFGVDHRLLLPLDDAIAAMGAHRRIHIDLPWAEGESGDGIKSTDDVVRFVARRIEQTLGDAPFAILGNSFGAMIARRIAHDHRDRVRGLATLAGVFVAEPAQRTLPPARVIVDDAGALAVAGHGDYSELAVVRTAENARAWRAHAKPGLDAADLRTLARVRAHYDVARRPEDDAPFTAPTLIITGRQDAVVGYADAWDALEHYPRATFAVLDAAGHNTHLDAPDLVAAHITDWLRRVHLADAAR